MTEEFFQTQPTSWMVKFYTFLLDHDRLWRRDKPRGPLLEQPFIRLQDNRHVIPLCSDGSPNVYLPGDSETDFDTVHRILAKPKKCAEFLRKLGLTEPDVTSEVLQRIVPQYGPDETDIPDKKHLTHLRKILRALGSDSPSRPSLVERLKELEFLRASDFSGKQTGFGKPGELYLRTRQLETFFGNHPDVWFLAEPEELVGCAKMKAFLKELGVEDKPRRILVETEDDCRRMTELRGGDFRPSGDIYFHQYDMQGLGDFLKALKRLDLPEATHRARLLWDFLRRHLEACLPGAEMNFFRGEYKWKYYRIETRHFDAYFLTVLRSKAWLPGKDGKLHKPSELLPQEMTSGFTRHSILCEELQMKAEVLVNLAKEAGVKVEDLVFIRQHREDFERLKRSLKGKPPASAKPVEPPSPMTPAQSSTESQLGQTPPRTPAAQAPEAAPGGGFVSGAPEAVPSAVPSTQSTVQAGPTAPATPRDAVDALLGPGALVNPPPPELDRPDVPVGTPPGSGDGTGGHGNAGGAATATGNDGQGPRAGQRQPSTGRLRSYVIRHPSPPEGPPDSESSARRDALAGAGIAKVVAFELGYQRQPEVKPLHHKGYDIESRDAAGEILRYIEVKSISGLWDVRGVGVTHPEFEKAQQLGDKFWLYVVERAEQQEARIYRIQDPARTVDQFMYDDGWREAAESP